MAINTNAGESIACSSPRLSFSHDLPEENPTEKQEQVEVIRLDRSLLLDTSPDFDFCVTTFPDETESCPADDLFFNGVIIPIQMKQKLNSIKANTRDRGQDDQEITAATTATLIREEKTQSKSFWRFRRSSSLNCDDFGHKKSSFWSLPLLLRSKSTGSSSFGSSNDHAKQNHKTVSSNNASKINNSSSRLSFSSYQKPPLSKSGSNNNSSGFVSARNNGPILNVPAPYIVKGTSDLLGFSSLFGNGLKDKKNMKQMR